MAMNGSMILLALAAGLHRGTPFHSVPTRGLLEQKARAAGVPRIYVNDNVRQWRSDATRLLQCCLRPQAPGLHFVEQLQPDDDDYFILKPMHSVFYPTSLDRLLRELGASSVILSSLATDICTLCTAHGVRHLKFIVPRDCCAARRAREHGEALEHIAALADAKVLSSGALRLRASRG
jgi:nicotinamidase-related amidase